MRTSGKTLIYTLFLLSGCTGLVYEVAWSRELIFVLGGTTYAITTVLVAFMTGLGLGSYTAGRISDRLRQPGRAYGYLEIVIGFYALAVPLLLRAAEPLYHAIYPHVAQTPGLLTAVQFLVSGMILLFPTICMGATLPILVHYITREGQAFGRSVSLLYGINTFGAMLGTMAAGFWLIRTFGLTKATFVAATANFLIGITAIIAFRITGEQRDNEPAGAKSAKAPSQKKAATTPSLAITDRLRLAVLIAFGISGFAAMVYQIAWTRALVMCVGSSTYAFTCILSAFIFGLAIGSLAIARWVDRLRQPVMVVGILQLAIALSAILIVPIHSHIPVVVRNLVSQYQQSYGTMLAYQFALIIAITVVPTFLIGTIFPLVTRIIATKDGATGAAVGRAYAVNTIGTVTGSFLAGFVMIRSDVLGVQNSIVTAALLNALVGAWLVLHSKPQGIPIFRRAVGVIPAVLAVPIIAATAGQWNRELITSGPYLYYDAPQEDRQIIYYADGVDLTVSVTRLKDQEHSLSLAVNGKRDASTGVADMSTQMLLGHLPALLTEDGNNACVIGLGSGITLSSVARYPSYKHIDCVEISTEVIEAAELFKPYNYNVLEQDSRVRMIRGDGRNHLLLTDQMYDLIISQPSNPWIAGVANLFTRDFFRLCDNRLNKNGRVCVWLQGYATSVDDFRMVIRTLSEVFPFITMWQPFWGDYLLIAGRHPFTLPLDDVLQRFNQESVKADLCRAGWSHLGQVAGIFVTSGERLLQWAASAQINTDDNAALEFSAPRNLYSIDKIAIARLLADQRHSPFDQVLIADPDNPKHKAVQDRAARITQARLDYLISLEYYRDGSMEKYIEFLWKAAQENPKDAMVRLQIGALKQSAMNQQFQLNPALLSDPSIPSRLFSMPPLALVPITGGSLDDLSHSTQSLAIYFLGKQKWDWAEYFLKEARDIDLEHADMLGSLIDVLSQGGGLAGVIRQLDQLLQQKPEDGRLNYLRAGCAAQEGQLDAAFALLEAALKAKDVTVKQLQESFMLQPLMSDQRINALLTQYATPPAMK